MKTWGLAASLAALALSVGQSALAQPETWVAKDARAAAMRITLATHQRMLAERMPGLVCEASMAVDRSNKLSMLDRARAQFETVAQGLAHGRDAYGLIPEQDPHALHSLARTGLHWTPLRRLYTQAVAGGRMGPRDFTLSIEGARVLQQDANALVAHLRGAYAPLLGQNGFGRALLIDLYGRQHMLAQRMAKDICLLAGGYRRAGTALDLTRTARLFERSMNAFRRGMPSAGIRAPRPDIAPHLDLAAAASADLSALVIRATTGEALARGDIRAARRAADRILTHMRAAQRRLVAPTEAGS